MKKHYYLKKMDNRGECKAVATILTTGITILIAAIVCIMSMGLTASLGKQGPVFMSATKDTLNDDSVAVTIQCVQSGSGTPILPCQSIRVQHVNSNGVVVESARLDEIYYNPNGGNLTYQDINHNAALDVGDQIIINTNGGGKLVLISTVSNNIILEVQV